MIEVTDETFTRVQRALQIAISLATLHQPILRQEMIDAANAFDDCANGLEPLEDGADDVYAGDPK